MTLKRFARYFGSTLGLPPGVPGGGIVIPGSTFGGLTVVSRLASGPGRITPLGGTEESARLSGAPAGPPGGGCAGLCTEGDCPDDTCEYAGAPAIPNRHMRPTIARSIENLLVFFVPRTAAWAFSARRTAAWRGCFSLAIMS